jgi:RNA polymerase sporulation-specific sigma factor
MDHHMDLEERDHADLVSQHLGLVRSLVQRIWKGREEEDLFQVGVIGLIKAVKNYDSSRGTAFSTYAVPLILGEIKGYLREDGLIKVSRDMKRKGALLQKMRSDFVAREGREPTLEEMSRQLNLDREEIAAVHESCSQPVSLQSKLSNSKGDESLTYEQVLAMESHEDLLEKVLLKESLAGLPKIEKQVIILRYFQEKTQLETGKILNLTQMQVSRLERKVLQKLREKMQWQG